MLKANERKFAILQRFFDLFLVFLAWVMAYVFRFYYLPRAEQGLAPYFLKLLVPLLVICLYVFNKEGLYKSLRFSSRFREINAGLKASVFSFLYFVIYLYFFTEARVSRIALFSYLIFSSFLLVAGRIMVRNFLRTLRAKGLNLRHVILIGNGPQLLKYVENMKSYKDSGIVFSGHYGTLPKIQEMGIPKIEGNIDEYINQNSPDSIIIGHDSKDADQLDSFLGRHYNTLTLIQILPSLSYSFIGNEIEDFDGLPIVTVNSPNFSIVELSLKRMMDFILTFCGVIFISPLLILIAFLIKLTSKGPIFYGQERMGLDGQTFTMWKFRSMSQAKENEDKNVWGSKDNPRTTKIGNLIRKTSLDELPQLWNVLKGEMTLVGPRPERPFFVEKFRKEIPGYMLRHKMKAGITGLAQINGLRGDTDLHKRIEYDMLYIKNWSLWNDIKILFLTFLKGWINKNAY